MGKRWLFVASFVFVMFALSGCGQDFKSQSIENRDYALNIKVEPMEDGYRYSFEVADLTEYKGDSGKSLKTEEYEHVARSLMEVVRSYYEEHGRQLDIGHIDSIELSGNVDQYKKLFEELREMPSVPKSVKVIYGDGEEALLRKLLK